MSRPRGAKENSPKSATVWMVRAASRRSQGGAATGGSHYAGRLHRKIAQPPRRAAGTAPDAVQGRNRRAAAARIPQTISASAMLAHPGPQPSEPTERCAFDPKASPDKPESRGTPVRPGGGSPSTIPDPDLAAVL